jgi:Presenilin
MSEQAVPRKKVTPLNLSLALVLVLVVQFLALGITYENKPVLESIGTVGTPISGAAGATPAGSAGNAFILVGLVVVTTFGLVWLVRKKLFRSFKTLIFASVSFSSFILTWLTVDGFFSRFSWYTTFPYVLQVELVIAFIPVAVLGYTIFVKDYSLLSTAVLVVVSAEVGSFFASTLPLLEALFLALLFAVYDIYAVFKGPLKTLVNSAPSGSLAGMSVKAGEFTVGLGDIVFYSMLPSLALYRLQLVNAFATMIAVDLGVMVTLYLLSRKRLLPGLPIPMLLGLIVLTISFV